MERVSALNFLWKGSAEEPLNFGVLLPVMVQERGVNTSQRRSKDWNLIKNPQSGK